MDAFLAEHLRGVSRTYAILIPMLPEPLAEAVGTAYLLMRIVDTLEDDPELTPDERVAFLKELERALDGAEGAARGLAHPRGENADERALMKALPEVLRRVRQLEETYRAAVLRCARTMSAGVQALAARSAQRGRAYPGIRDLAELREYCYYVAGVVGEMLCTMMAHYLRLPALERLRDVAVELGTGLQLVNILKDARKDAGQGRRYLPDVADVTYAHVYQMVVLAARHCLRRGVEFVLALPATERELRSFCGLPIVWGAMTLTRAEQAASAAKIDRATIQASIAEFGGLAGDDQALRDWLARLLQSEPRP